MKNTWKCVLAALAVSAILGGSLLAQTDDGVVVIGKGRGADPKTSTPTSGSAAGAVKLNQAGSSQAPSSSRRVTPTSGYVVSEGNYPETIQPSGIQYSEPAGGYHGTQAYGEFAASGSVGYAVCDDPRKVLFGFGRRNGDIYGLNEGYTNLSAFVPYFTEADSALWFVQPRLNITDQGRGAMNLGVGHRAYSHALDRVFSFSTWWDYDAGHEGEYNQVGASFAMIGRNTTFRANGNWVVSEDEHFVGQIPLGSSRLENGMVVQDVTSLTEVAYNQADVEVSMPIPLLDKYGFEWGGGAYFLFGTDGPDATGAKGRIEAQITEDLWVNAIISNDKVFETNVSVNFELTIPNAPPSRWFRRNKVRDSLLASDRRYYRVATDIVRRMDTVPVMMDNGSGGVQMLRLAIIDPNIVDDPALAFGGTGTEEDPFRSVLDYMEEDASLRDDFAIVFVRRRNDESDTNLDTTITLLDRQALLGEGLEHSLTNLGVTGITLPGRTDNVVPLLTNSSALGMDVVTLANANQVSGFTIDANGTANGIVGTGIDGFSITENTIQNVFNGIQIVSDTTGPVGTNLGFIQDNIINGIVPTQTSLASSTNGILIDHRAGTLNLFVNWNTVSNFRGEDRNANGVLDLSEDTDMDGMLDPGEDRDFDGVLDPTEDLDGDGVLDRGFGLRVVSSNSSVIRAFDPTGDTGYSISQNTFTGNGTGASIEALDSSRIFLDFFENVATGSTGADADSVGKLSAGMTGPQVAAGFRFLADGGRIDISTFTDNSATGGSGSGAIFQTLNSGVITVTNPTINAFDDNVFSGNGLDGMFVEADSGTILFDQISNSLFNNNGDDGLDMQTDNAGMIAVRDPLTGNQFTGNGDNGIELTGGVGGGISVAIGDDSDGIPNVISGNGTNGSAESGAGVFIGTVGGTIEASLRGITSSNNAGSGATILAEGGTIMLDGIAGNVFRLNGRHGLEIIANNGGRVITPFVGSASMLLGDDAGLPGTADFSNDFSLNEEAGLFLGGSNDAVGGETGLIDLGTVTLNRFQRLGEDIDGDGRIDVAEPDTNMNGMLDEDEDIDGDGHRDVAENVDGVIANGVLDPSQGEEGILIGASDLRIIGTLTRNSFIGRRPVFNSEDTGELLVQGSGRGIGGIINGSSTIGGPGGLSLAIGTAVPGDANTFLDSGDAHIGLIMRGNTVNSIEVDNGTFNDAFDRPGTSAFMGEGIHYILRDTATLTGFINNSTLSNNVGDGLLIEIAGNNDAGNDPSRPAASLNDFMIVDNTISNNGSEVDQDGDGEIDPILSSGIKIVRTERGQFNDLLINWNVIEGNTENGITIDSSGANFLNLANMRADTVEISDNTIRNNLQDGIEFSIGSDADVAARLDNNIITNNGFGEAGGAFEDVGNGIEVREFIQQAKDSRSLTGWWTNNVVSDNFDDGIDLSGLLGNFIVEAAEAGAYTVAPPAMGTQFPVLGELRNYGLVIGDITLNPIGTLSSEGNFIQGNNADGIDLTAGGAVTIANNSITENGTLGTLGDNPLVLPFHAGINIDPPELNEGINVDLTGRTDRALPNDDFDPTKDAYRDVFIFSNFISLNNGDGIEFLSQSSIDAADSASSGGLGGASVETRLMIALNEITQNEGRGIDILQRPGSGIPQDMDETKILDELTRGVQDPDGVSGILNSGFVSADVSIIGNHIKDNAQEGVYVVQTVDDGQNQISPSNNVFGIDGMSISNGESLRAQGIGGDIVRLRLDIHDNQIIANGRDVLDLPGTGLVIRVGTSGGGGVFGGYVAPIDDPNTGTAARPANYFATSGSNAEDLDGDGVLDNDLDGDGYLDAAPVIGSGISASVTGNLFDGNFGHDLLFHSFTATFNPVDTEGTWTPPTFDDMGMLTDPGEFTVDTFQPDPLARFDLILSNNFFNSIEPNNNDQTIGTSPGNAGEADAGAYYNNDEPEFKSREIDTDNPGGGPFTLTARLRNATRFASRYITNGGLPPFPGETPANENGIFKYPGLGNSTFRVRGMGNAYTDQGLGAVGLDQIFIFDEPELVGDPDLIDAAFEANGVFPSAGDLNLSLPWGWDDLEPGTPALPAMFP